MEGRNVGDNVPTLALDLRPKVILHRSAQEEARVIIVPGSDRAEDDRDQLPKFQQHDVVLDDPLSLVETAKAAMGLDNGTRAFSNDILRVEIAGPTQPHLALVDLPGLFTAPYTGGRLDLGVRCSPFRTKQSLKTRYVSIRHCHAAELFGL